VPLPPETSKRAPKVSILLITYNHEKYIAQALEGILMQETEYDYEINVIEDCSTDRTQEIVMRYVERYPDKVKPFFNAKNIGSKVTQKNFFRGFKMLDGEYFAILEGDDYWTSPHKLQKQVAFLEANRDYVACAHHTLKVCEDGSREPERFLHWEGKSNDITIHDLILLDRCLHVASIMYRNVFKGVPPSFFISPWSCEICVNITHAQFGKIQYFDEDMAVYRAHSGGRFSTMKKLESWVFNIGGLRRYNEWLGYRYCKTFAQSIVRYCNVVLRDKGGEAAPLNAYQFAKYFALRTLYQILHGVLSIPDKVPFAVERCSRVSQKRVSHPSQDGRNGALHVSRASRSGGLYLKENMVAIVLYPFRVCIAGIRGLPNALVLAVYLVSASAVPSAVKEGIRRFEISHAGIRTIRHMIRTRTLLSREGRLHCLREVTAHARNIALGLKRRILRREWLRKA
jgi:glycosyltransferase involved in cell wall biosynthesis